MQVRLLPAARAPSCRWVGVHAPMAICLLAPCRAPRARAPPLPWPLLCLPEGFSWQGTHAASLFGWAENLTSLVVALAVAVGLCLLGVSTFAINCVDRRPYGILACVALVAEPFLAVGFARGSYQTCWCTSWPPVPTFPSRHSHPYPHAPQ